MTSFHYKDICIENKDAKKRITIELEDLRNIFDMEEVDYLNKHIPEEVAPYTKEIFKMLREQEVILWICLNNIFKGKICCNSWLHEKIIGY